MCRLLGVVSSETTDYAFSLRHAPKSLALLSRDHPDGWGLAVFGRDRGWEVHRHAACAGDDSRFDAIAGEARGELLVAHIRKRTVGPLGVDNTHPFRAGEWVFAHNGTFEDVRFLEAHASRERLAEVRGDTDSERMFAFILSEIDRASDADSGAIDAAVTLAAASLRARCSRSSANFLLSNGSRVYAHRLGRTLYLLERGQGDEVRSSRVSQETGAVVDTPWSPRRVAILIASERMTDEPWQELPENALVRIDAEPSPSWRVLDEPTGTPRVRPRELVPT